MAVWRCPAWVVILLTMSQSSACTRLAWWTCREPATALSPRALTKGGFFVERQQKKGAVFRELLKDVPLRRGDSLKTWIASRRHSGISSCGIRNGRRSLLNRPDPPQALGIDRPKDVSEDAGGTDAETADKATKVEAASVAQPPPRPKTVHFPEASTRPSATVPSSEGAAPSSAHPQTASAQREMPRYCGEQQGKQPAEETQYTHQLLGWARKGISRRRSGSPKLVRDPRYVSLERALCPVYVPESPSRSAGVPVVIQSISSFARATKGCNRVGGRASAGR